MLINDTLILMADKTSKPLAEINVGDIIIGIKKLQSRKIHSLIYAQSKVLDKWKRFQTAIEIILENGIKIICSLDHRWLTDRGWKCTTGEMVGTNRRPYLTTSNSIRGIGYLVKTPQVTKDYMRGYLSGQIQGDGLLGFYDYTGRRSERNIDVQYQFRLVQKDFPSVSRTHTFLEHFGVDTNWFNFSMKNKDGTIIQTKGIRTNTRDNFNKIQNLIKFSNKSREFYRGFLAGIFDSEGYGGGFRKSRNSYYSIIRISNSSEEILFQINKALELFNFKSIMEHSSNNDVKIVRILGGIGEYLRFFQITDIANKRKINLEGMALNKRIKVKTILPLPREWEMINITTETGNYLANGLVSHN